MNVTYASEKLTKTLHRHFVSLICIDRGPRALKQNNGKPVTYNFSGFIVELNGEWLVVTAGHVFGNLEKAQKSGAELIYWQIDDSSVSANPQPPNVIPLDIEKDVLYLDDDVPGIDYAAFKLPKLICMAMEKEGIVPIRKELWRTDELAQFSTWLLVGVPYETVKVDYNAPHHEKYIVTIKVDRLAERPEGLEEKPYERLFAKIDFESIGDNGPKITDIGGMSGGPIFGLRGDDQNFEYRLIGVQSCWNEKVRDAVAMCAAQPFINTLQNLSF
jgi:hypothetical protein